MVKNNWSEVFLRELVDIRHGFAFQGEYFTDEETPNILLTPGNFAIGGGYKDDKLKYYFGEVPHEYVLSPHDLIVTMTDLSKNMDTLGYSALVPDEPEKRFLHNQRLGKVIIYDKKQVDKYFLYYLLRTEDYRDEVRASASGSVIKHTSPERIRNYKFLLPSILEQRAIAGVLGALDDKIELSRRINRMLESMTRAVFRQWFVQSDEAKGWQDLKWGDIATLEYGKSLSDYKFADASYIVYGTNGAIGRHTEFLYPSEGIIVGRKGAYRGIHYSPNPFFVIDTAFYLKPQKPFSMKWAYYELLRLDLNSMDSGSAIPSTSRADFYDLPVMFPSQEVMDAFESFATPLFSKIYANEAESLTLARLRDSLLPKLMKGEIRVKE